jgi:N-acetylglutamate synthase-like GNAT family acetyltransferase
MTPGEAAQIAKLLNERNQLVVKYDEAKVLGSVKNYIYDVSAAGQVTSCVELKKVQWYQFEIRHLTVDAGHIRKGLAQALVTRCEAQAKNEGGRVLQCTIRAGNTASETLFEKAGFKKISQFFNLKSNNQVGIWQKVISLGP